MADDTNPIQINVTAETTLLNNFINNEIVETNTEKANASFINLPEINLTQYFQELEEQKLRSEKYSSPKLDELPSDTKSDIFKLQKEFNSFKSELNEVLPKNIEQIYSTLSSLMDDMNERDKPTDPRPVKPFINDIFSFRSKQINTPPIWI